MYISLPIEHSEAAITLHEKPCSKGLEYHGKLRNTKQVWSFQQLFDWRKDRISYHQKVQNKNFSVISKYGIPWNIKYLIVFWELKDHLFQFLKHNRSFLYTKERSSFYQLSALKKIPFFSQKSIISAFSLSAKFIIWTFLFFLMWTFISWIL